MPLELVEPGEFKALPRLQESEASLTRSGALYFRREAWDVVSGGARAAVLVDTGRLILAIRPPRADEKSYAVHVALGSGKRDTGRREVNVLRALRRLCLEPAATAGRWPLMTKNDVLLIHLGGKPEKDHEAKQ